MYGREELEKHCTTMRGWYFADEADKVMYAMEARIKDLEDQLENVQSSMYAENVDANMALVKANERIKELEKALSNAVAGGNIALEQAKKLESQLPKWISVEDKLPKEGEEVIVFYTSWKHEYQQVVIFEYGEFIDQGGCALSPTHWMPLPPPPTTEDK